jgi:hypothetical protein
MNRLLLRATALKILLEATGKPTEKRVTHGWRGNTTDEQESRSTRPSVVLHSPSVGINFQVIHGD